MTLASVGGAMPNLLSLFALYKTVCVGGTLQMPRLADALGIHAVRCALPPMEVISNFNKHLAKYAKDRGDGLGDFLQSNQPTPGPTRAAGDAEATNATPASEVGAETGKEADVVADKVDDAEAETEAGNEMDVDGDADATAGDAAAGDGDADDEEGDDDEDGDDDDNGNEFPDDPVSLQAEDPAAPPKLRLPSRWRGARWARPRCGLGRGRGRGRGSGAVSQIALAKPRGRPKRSRVKPRSADDFAVGSRVTVFWQKDQAWFHGVIEDTQGEGDLVMSKVQYDDGDVEVIDIFGGTHKVRLMQRPDGTPASDADEPLDAGSSLENDDGDPDGTEMPAGSRLRMRGTDGDARNDPSGKRGPGRPKGRPSGQNQSRRSAGKETSPPQRAPGADPGLTGLTNELVKRRNPARVSAMEKMDTDGVHYDYGELPPEEEFPITDEKVLAVLAMIESNETARALADLPNDPEPSAEVFRLGYKVRPWGFPKSRHTVLSLS